MKKKGRRGDYFFERSLLRLISFWSSRSPPLLGHEERDFWGQKDSSFPSVKAPKNKGPNLLFIFLAKRGKRTHTKRKKHKKKFFFFIRFSLCTSADRFKTNTKHTQTRRRKKEREGIKARRRRRRRKQQRADRYTERKYVWISVSEKVTN
jgi:hypothetical protein